MCVLDVLTRILFFVYGTLCPAYNTYKSLAHQREEQFAAWSKYWIVYAFLVCLELLSDLVLSWLPLYSAGKLLVVLWVVMSAPRASVWLYDAILNPVLSQRQRQIDQFLQRGQERFLSNFIGYSKDLFVGSQCLLMPLVWQFWLRCSGGICQVGAAASRLKIMAPPEHSNSPSPAAETGANLQAVDMQSSVSPSETESSEPTTEESLDISALNDCREQLRLIIPQPMAEPMLAGMPSMTSIPDLSKKMLKSGQAVAARRRVKQPPSNSKFSLAPEDPYKEDPSSDLFEMVTKSRGSERHIEQRRRASKRGSKADNI